MAPKPFPVSSNYTVCFCCIVINILSVHNFVDLQNRENFTTKNVKGKIAQP